MTLGYVGALPPGDEGTRETLERMAAVARQMQLFPKFTILVHGIVLWCPERDASCYAAEIRRWLSRFFRFVPDARDWERFADEQYLLTMLDQNGMISGDCDCLAVLAAGMGLIVNLSPRFVVLAFPSTGDEFGHVFTELETPRGWQSMDTTRLTGPVEQASRAATFPV